MEILLVGGAVRDKLLGIEIKDQDWLVVGGTPEYFIEKNYQQVGNDFPVFLHPETAEEYALARKERKVGAGYNGFEFEFSPEVTAEEDLFRRDLTINAIAMRDDGSLIDPFGGVKDIEDKVLRHVSDHFAEDPVRVLRVARFMARYAHMGFTVANDTMDMMKQIGISGELNSLTAERVWLELEKVFKEPTPSEFFKVLKEAEVLKYVFPEIDNLFGVPQPEAHHPEIDTGVHVLMVLDQAKKLSGDTAVMFAALTHDLGKFVTHMDETIPATKHPNHEKLGVPLVAEMCDRLKTPADVRKLAIFTARYHTYCHRVETVGAQAMYRLMKAADFKRRPELLEKFFLACEADARGRKDHENCDYPQPEYMRRVFQELKDAGISKKLVEAGVKGKELGEKIESMEIEYLSSIIQNPPEKVKALAEKYADFVYNLKKQDPSEVLSVMGELGAFSHKDYKYRRVTEEMAKIRKVDLAMLEQLKKSFKEIDVKEIAASVGHYSEIGDALNEKKKEIISEALKAKLVKASKRNRP